MAITKACEAVSAVMAEEGVPSAVTIYSDSQSVLQALNSRWITSKTVWECASALTDLGEFVSVHLRWVKGHSGIRGNEEADRIAKEAAGSDGLVPDRPIPRSSSYYRQAFKDFLFLKWKTRWETIDPEFARQTRIWFPEPCFRKSRRILALPRDMFSSIVRWLIGHAFLRLQNFRAGCGIEPADPGR